MEWFARAVLPLILLCPCLAVASPATCDRGFSEERLNEKEKKALKEGELVLRFQNVNDYAMGYAMQDVELDPELVMGVYISANEHSKKLGSFIKKSKILTEKMPVPVFRVAYQQDVKYLSDADYVVENTVTEREKLYLLQTSLVSADDASFSPKWLDAFFRVERLDDGRARITACNYQVPRSGMQKGTFNSEARSRFKRVAENLEKWVYDVANDSNKEKAKFYRDSLRTMLDEWKK